MTEFTPLASAFGGALIGLSAVLLLAINGRIAGISGISSAILPPWGARLKEGDIGWRITFIVGLMAAPILVQAVSGEPIQQTVSSNVALMVIAGLVTGFGSVYGGGCTSGHGVCGISRLSLRGIVATVFYLLAGGISVILFKHMLGVI